jgi:4-diphosphocytidyl-2-C-methyl-D-erythritol kinase
MKELQYYSYAKINLGLEILSKRSDGYHLINSIFLPISLYDTLTFHTSSTFQIQVYPSTIRIPLQENLIYKSIKLIENKYKININLVQISLAKNIPIGSGLGGGSSNAATTLVALNEIYSLNLSKAELKELANQIGADVPFFIEPKPSLVSGIGDVIEPIDFRFDFPLVLIYPNFPISTKFAYSLIQLESEKEPTNFKDVLKQISHPKEFADVFRNDFEPPLFEIFPELAEIKSKLLELGAFYASLSGSGSTIYGIFTPSADLESVCREFSKYLVFIAKCL